ncbi:MAG: MoxR family ATPase [Anaerolineales bacterium]
MITLQTEERWLHSIAAGENGRTPALLLARERVGLFENQPKSASPMDLQQFLHQVRELGEEIRSQLVAMDAEVELVLTALLAGENVFFLSLPSAAKTTLARMVAQGIDGRFFRINLNPDISRNDLFGPLDPIAIREGRWERKLSGLATAAVANIDELFKGSGANRNMLLEAFEEHTLTEPDRVHRLPLQLGIAASNELVNAVPQNAIWDRILLRKEVGYPARAQDWHRLVDSAGGRVPIETRLDPEEILLTQAFVEYQAMQISDDMTERMVRIWQKLAKAGIQISPRRFKGWARAAVAHTLLRGEDGLSPKSLMVGRHILWIGLEDRREVDRIVGKLSHPERQLLIVAAADLEEIRAALPTESSMQMLTKWRTALKRHVDRVDTVEHPELEAKKSALVSDMKRAQEALVERGGQIMDAKVASPTGGQS